MAAMEEPMMPTNIAIVKNGDFFDEMELSTDPEDWKEDTKEVDLYTQLKVWQRQLEFLEIQVRFRSYVQADSCCR